MAYATDEGAVSGAFAAPPHTLWGDALARLGHSARAWAAGTVLVLFVLVGLAAPWLAPHPYDFQSRARPERGNGGAGLPPAWVQTAAAETSGKPGYWLGTDTLGRDLLSRTMYAATVSLAVGVIPLLLTLPLGLAVGLAAGYRGGRTDSLVMRLIDVLYAFPDLLLFIILAGILRPTFVATLLGGLPLIILALSLTTWIGLARLVRGQILALREKPFVEAARVVGAKPAWIMRRHLLPNILGPVIVRSSQAIPGYILAEGALDYLGLGMSGTYPTWGTMIDEGQSLLTALPHVLWVPVTCLALVTVAFFVLGDSLADALDPRGHPQYGGPAARLQ